MAKYSVSIQVYATMYMKVEADSEEEAREKAEKEAYEPTLCWQCSDEVEIDGVGDVLSASKITGEE